LTLALAGGVLRVLGVHLHIFHVNYAWTFFSPPWGCRCTHCTPPGYAYVIVAHSVYLQGIGSSSYMKVIGSRSRSQEQKI